MEYGIWFLVMVYGLWFMVMLMDYESMITIYIFAYKIYEIMCHIVPEFFSSLSRVSESYASRVFAESKSCNIGNDTLGSRNTQLHV